MPSQNIHHRAKEQSCHHIACFFPEPHHQKNIEQAPFTTAGASSCFWYLKQGWLGWMGWLLQLGASLV